MNIARAVRKVAYQVMKRANSWQAKESGGIFDEFLRDVRLLLPDVLRIDPESDTREPSNQHALDMRKMARALGISFGSTEAEARMASFLMQQGCEEVVDVYCTDSPCGPCSRTFAALEPAKAKIRERMMSIYKNPVAHPGMNSDGRLMPGFGWQIGWLFYGSKYVVENKEKCTDMQALYDAVEEGSIEGHGAI
jgi:hypothetical protein